MDVNFWAVLVAAVASMVIGSLWYGPLFGKAYVKAMGWNNHTPEEKQAMRKEMRMNYFWQFVASILMFYVLALLMYWLQNGDAKMGMATAFWIWLGFVVPLKFGDALWGGKKSLFWIGIGGNLITLLVGAAIVGAWK